MKLLVIATIKEQTPELSKLLKKAGLPVFSIIDAVGVKNLIDENLTDDWFGRGVGEFESSFIVSFMQDHLVNKTLAAINLLNQSTTTDFPVRTFVMAVEQPLN
jgi:hypothetical protein